MVLLSVWAVYLMQNNDIQACFKWGICIARFTAATSLCSLYYVQLEWKSQVKLANALLQLLFQYFNKILFLWAKSEASASSCQRQFCLGGTWLVTGMSLESVSTWQALRASSLWIRSWWVNSNDQQCFLRVMPKPFTSSSPVQTEFYWNSHTSISAAMMRGLMFF